MYTLAYDTTAAACSVTLFANDECKELFVQEMDFGQAEILIPEIDKILQNQHLTFKDIDVLAVCVGPGSFTGVRSSVSAARAFGLACPNLEVIGITAFEVYAHAFMWQPENIAPVNAVIIETKRDDFYYQLFDEHLKPLSQPSAADRDDIIAELKQTRKKITFTGDGVERFLNTPTGLPIHGILKTNRLDVKDLARCAIEAYKNKKHNYPKPLYLRAPDVCVK